MLRYTVIIIDYIVIMINYIFKNILRNYRKFRKFLRILSLSSQVSILIWPPSRKDSSRAKQNWTRKKKKNYYYLL